MPIWSQAFAALGAIGIFQETPWPGIPWQAAEALAFLLPAGLIAWDVQSAQKQVRSVLLARSVFHVYSAWRQVPWC